MNPIDRRSLMAAFTGAGASLLAPSTLAKPAKVAGKKRQPNFIIILADDLGYGDFSATGSGSIKTPNIDKMASEG